MPKPALLLLIATLLPLASFVVLMFAGRRMGNPLAGWFGTAAIAGSFLCSLAAMLAWYQTGHMSVPGPNGSAIPITWGYEHYPINKTMKWIPIGTTHADGAVAPGGLAQD